MGVLIAVTTNAVIIVSAAWSMTIKNERRFTRIETLLEHFIPKTQ